MPRALRLGRKVRKAVVRIAFVGALGIVMAGGAQQGELPLEVRVPRLASPDAQLAYARRLKRELGEREGRERDFWCQLAVEAYEAVPHYHPEARGSGAEALFRAGELLRCADHDARALTAFRRARAHELDGPFHTRSELEIGHLHRRAGHDREALDAYLNVASDPRAAPERRDDAWLWAARIWERSERHEDARRAWKLVATEGVSALDRILAYDDWALSLVRAGDLEGAAGLLSSCKLALRDVALEETHEGERVRRALLRMRVVDVLPRAIRTRKALQRDEGKSEKTLTR